MANTKHASDRVTKWIRWIARIWGIATIGLVLLMSSSNPPTWPMPVGEFVLLLFFPFGVCLGMIVAWRWEGLGGGITVGSLLAFYAAFRVIRWRFPPAPTGPFFVLLAAPGFLFLVCWWRSRKRAIPHDSA